MLKTLVVLLFILLCSLGGWYLANPDMWNNRILVKPEAVLLEITSAPKAEIPVSNIYFVEGEGGSSCSSPATGKVGVKEASIYRWTDANGQVHFGDEKPAVENAELYDAEQGVTLDYFDLSIDYRGKNTVPFLEGQISAQATSIYEIMANLVGSENVRHVPLNIVIFSDVASFRQYARTLAGDKVDNLDGLYSTRTNEAMTFTANDEVRTMEVIKHEATHVIVRGIFGDLPVWLNEGLAEYFAKLNIRGQLSEVTADNQAQQLALATLQSGYPARFTDFLQLESDHWYDDYQSNHYALAASLVYFMMDTDAGKQVVKELVHKMAQQYCQSLNSAVELGRLYPGGLNALEKEFYGWLRNHAAKTPHTY